MQWWKPESFNNNKSAYKSLQRKDDGITSGRSVLQFSLFYLYPKSSCQSSLNCCIMSTWDLAFEALYSLFTSLPFQPSWTHGPASSGLHVRRTDDIYFSRVLAACKSSHFDLIRRNNANTVAIPLLLREAKKITFLECRSPNSVSGVDQFSKYVWEPEKVSKHSELVRNRF